MVLQKIHSRESFTMTNNDYISQTKTRMEKYIAHKFFSTSNAFSSLALLLSCVYGREFIFCDVGTFILILASWNLFLANWENFNKLFLYGYLWYGFCGGTATMSVLRCELFVYIFISDSKTYQVHLFHTIICPIPKS